MSFAIVRYSAHCAVNRMVCVWFWMNHPSMACYFLIPENIDCGIICWRWLLNCMCTCAGCTRSIFVITVQNCLNFIDFLLHISFQRRVSMWKYVWNVGKCSFSSTSENTCARDDMKKTIRSVVEWGKSANKLQPPCILFVQVWFMRCDVFVKLNPNVAIVLVLHLSRHTLHGTPQNVLKSLQHCIKRSMSMRLKWMKALIFENSARSLRSPKKVLIVKVKKIASSWKNFLFPFWTRIRLKFLISCQIVHWFVVLIVYFKGEVWYFENRFFSWHIGRVFAART